nr:hypothetical protein OG999_29445 [Streptomyces sp. NBC_00886]
MGVEAALRLPNVMMLVVEDACTALSREGWRRREPVRWRFQARRRRQTEGRQLDAKENRVRDLAVQCLDASD